HILRLGLPKTYVKQSLTNDPSEEKAKIVVDAVNAVAPAILAQRFIHIASMDRDFGPGVRCPLLNIRGSQDRLVFKRHADEISAKYPRSIRIEIDGPHLLFLMRPKELSEVLIEFFDSSQQRRSSAPAAAALS